MNETARLLAEAFPKFDTFPPDCWVRAEFTDEANDFGDEIAIVRKHGQTGYLLERLRNEHPSTRRHLRQDDDRVLGVLTEARAFAWAVEVGLGRAKFVTTEGAPDIRAGNWHVEAKSIQRSDADREELDSLHRSRPDGLIVRGARTLTIEAPGFRFKFDYDVDDAVKKWRRQVGGKLAIFIDIYAIDFGFTIRHRADILRDWARAAERRTVATVVVSRGNWRDPVYAGDLS